MSTAKQSQLSIGLLVAAIAVGSIGYFLGISRAAAPQGYGSSRSAAAGQGSDDDVVDAPTQAQLADSLHRPNRLRLKKNFDSLQGNRRGLMDEVERVTEAEWNEAITARAQHRAFAGAPPTIPHDVEQAGFPDCIACHESGLVLEGRTAPQMSHERVAACTQCHLVHNPPVPGREIAGGVPTENNFDGMTRWGRGERAFVGAPRTVPHPTYMREQCSSCHGVLATGLRTSHACQQSCEQCHAPAAGLDQRTPFGEQPMPLASLPSAGPPPLGAGPPPLRPSKAPASTP